MGKAVSVRVSSRAAEKKKTVLRYPIKDIGRSVLKYRALTLYVGGDPIDLIPGR
jgi:hypothetical protein